MFYILEAVVAVTVVKERTEYAFILAILRDREKVYNDEIVFIFKYEVVFACLSFCLNLYVCLLGM